MKKLLATLPLLALLSCTGIPPQHALSHFDWTEPADPQGEKPETWNGVEKPIVTFGSTDVRYPRATPCAAAVTDQTTLTGWRGEKVSAQAVISAPAAVGGLTCTEGVEVWSDEHFERMRPTMRQLADAGQKVITATLNKDPWNNQCYDAYADMIVWTRLADGTWEYDFTVFDRWVRFMLDLGVGKYVNCYSMLPWNNMLHYKDAVTGEFVDVKADPGTPAFREMWGPFLPAFVGHLREKGWLGITNIAMDERSPEVMAAATALLKEVAPELGIALADNHKIFKQYPYIKDMCASIFGPIEQTDIVQRRSKGLTTTFYVCCSSGFPNTYTSSAPAEATYLSWYAAAEDYDGFLRWAYNSWVEDPIRDSRFRKWAAGDTYLVYPEGRSSIRFERLVEGIQDWEKIRLLKTEFSGDDAKLQTLHDLLEPFRSSVAFDGWEQTLRNARATLNTL